MPHTELITSKEAARMLGIAVETLCRWRLRGDGPRWIQQGRWVRYNRHDVQAFMLGRDAA